MSQILVFVAQLGKIALVHRLLLVFLRNGIDIQQSCLPQEDSFYLKEVVAMVIDGVQGYRLRPSLKRFPIDAETVVACQRNKVSSFPRAVAEFYTLVDVLRLPLQPLRLQCTHPRMNGELRQTWDNPVARRILVGSQQFSIMLFYLCRNRQKELRQLFAVLRIYIGIG